MDTDIVDWIRAELKKPGKSKGGLAEALGRSGSAVTAILNGTRTIKTFEVPKIAAYLGSQPPQETAEVVPFKGDLVPVAVAGTVEAGAFREADEFADVERVVIYEPRDKRFPDARIVAFDVSGDSMNDLRPRPILPGDRVVCVDFDDLLGRFPLQPGMIVVIERVRDGGHLREWSVKQVELYEGRTEFWPRSTNRSHKPIVVQHNPDADDGTSVRVLARVIAVRSEFV